MKVLSIGEKEISLRELLGVVKSAGRDKVNKPLVRQSIIEKYAVENDITVTVEELQERFDNMCRRRGLHAAGHSPGG